MIDPLEILCISLFSCSVPRWDVGVRRLSVALRLSGGPWSALYYPRIHPGPARSRESEAGILFNYPGLTHDDILAWLAYASHLAHEYRAPAPRLMRLLADENFPLPAVTALRPAGHDVTWALLRTPPARATLHC